MIRSNSHVSGGGEFRLGCKVPMGHHRLKGHLTDHDPLGGEKQLQLHELAHTMVQLDGDVAGVFENPVLHVLEADGLALVEPFPSHTKHHLGLGKHLHFFGELVVAEDVHAGEFADALKLKPDFDWAVSGLVLPSHPSLAFVLVGFEVVLAEPSINQLTQTVLQLVAIPNPVISGTRLQSDLQKVGLGVRDG